MVAYLRANPGIGVIGPRVLRAGTDEEIAEDAFSVWPGIVQHFTKNQGRCARTVTASPRPVPFVSGACLLTRKELFSAVGGLDPVFFAYFEDWDYCKSLSLLGYSTWHLPSARVWHKEAATLGRRSTAYLFLMTRNRFLMARKWLPSIVFYPIFIPYFILYRVLLKSVVFLARGEMEAVSGVVLACVRLLGRGGGEARIWPLSNAVPPVSDKLARRVHPYADGK